MFFDDFKDSQNVSYYLLRNSLLNNRLSHAYLVDANNNDNAYDFVMAFIKMILCDNHYSCYSSDKCGSCHLCERIQNGNYMEIKVISAESNVIRKEQLLDLQSDFSRFSIEGKYRIYIIKDCDKMNKQASNSLLKFLEEPVEGIIAILITNNFNKILSTIVSRCQIVRLNHTINYSNYSSFDNLALVCCDNASDISNFINDDLKKDIMQSVIDFILYFEDNGLDTLVFMKKLWYNKIQSKEDSLFAFKVMVYFYYDVLKCKLDSKDFLFCSHVDSIKNVANSNSLDVLIKKNNIVQYGYDMIISNLNVNLLLDDVVIRLGDVCEYS